MGRTSITQRSILLNQIADRMEEHLSTLALAETWDNGKPIREAMVADIPLAIDHFRYCAGCIRAQEGGAAEIDHDTVVYHFRPHSEWSRQIIPWNFPSTHGCLEACACACHGELRHPKAIRTNPASILVVGGVDRRSVPPGVLNIVNGYGKKLGKPLASSPRIAKIAFTGATQPAEDPQICKQNMTPVTLELGGKSPNIFFEDVAAKTMTSSIRRLRDSPCSPSTRAKSVPVPAAH